MKIYMIILFSISVLCYNAQIKIDSELPEKRNILGFLQEMKTKLINTFVLITLELFFSSCGVFLQNQE